MQESGREPSRGVGRVEPRREESRASRLAAAQRVLATAEANAGLRQRLTGVTTLTTAAESAPSSSAERVGAVEQWVTPSELLLPVPEAVAPVLPEGALRRGTAAQVSGSTSLLLLMAAAACAVPGEEIWCAVVAMPDVGLAAAAEAGLDLQRTVVVPRPGPDAAAVLGALIDGFDVVVLGRCPALSDADRRAIGHRLRTREAVLLSGAVWPGAQVVLEVGERAWFGVGDGDGVLTGREATVTGYARGMGASRAVRVRMPAEGGILPAAPVPVPVQAPDLARAG